MITQPYSLSTLQSCKSLLTSAIAVGMGIDDIIVAIDGRLAGHRSGEVRPAAKRRQDNIAVCSACGKPAVIVPLSISDRTPTATHAVQCQHRPATDQPWLPGMCGHTAYIVRGER